MRLKVQPWQFAALLVLVCAGAIVGFYFYRAAGASTPGELASYLPLADGALVYLDVDALRRSGILDLVAGKKAAEELEYQSFVEETKFDYREDLDALAALFKPGQVFMTVRGRFNWKSLIAYVNHHGGSCVNGFCTVRGSKPERRISFYPIKSNVMALAVSADSWAAYQITRKSGRLPIAPPLKPAWALLTGPALKDIAALPAGTKSFATALEHADSMLFSVDEEGDRLELDLAVSCPSADRASVLLDQLQSTTDTLRRWLDRERQKPNPDDLSGVLTTGSFRRDDRKVFGTWPLRRSFIESLAGGSN